jgi:hypothetical protein
VTAVGDVLELVRAPAALTVIGDGMAGAYAGGGRPSGRRWLLPLASVFLYSGGMALNDYADRRLDAVERPERPIPSGRIAPRSALGIAGACLAVGLGLAATGGGRRGVAVAVPLVAAIASYNTVFKETAAGPVSMAACRGLDVLMGARSARAAMPAAAVLALHTAGVTALSRGEVHGGSTGAALAGLAVTGATTIAAVAGGRGRGDGSDRCAAAIAGAAAGAGGAAYAGSVLPSQLAALADPSAANMRSATRAGIGGMIPLQATLVARTGALVPALVLGALDLVRRGLASRRRAGDVT